MFRKARLIAFAVILAALATDIFAGSGYAEIVLAMGAMLIADWLDGKRAGAL